MTEAILHAAQVYIDNGISVVPVNPLDSEKPKGPLNNMSWKTYQERYATPDELKRWFSGPSKARIGLVGGKVSRGLVILDIDNLELADLVRTDYDFMDDIR